MVGILLEDERSVTAFDGICLSSRVLIVHQFSSTGTQEGWEHSWNTVTGDTRHIHGVMPPSCDASIPCTQPGLCRLPELSDSYQPSSAVSWCSGTCHQVIRTLLLLQAAFYVLCCGKPFNWRRFVSNTRCWLGMCFWTVLEVITGFTGRCHSGKERELFNLYLLFEKKAVSTACYPKIKMS